MAIYTEPTKYPEKKKVQPRPVRKLKCVKCGELLFKIFPYCAIEVDENTKKTIICTRCEAKAIFIRDMDRLGQKVI